MRGTKLLGWKQPKVFSGNTDVPENSMLPYAQEKLQLQINQALAAVAVDVRRGLLEIIGLESEWWTDNLQTSSIVIFLPPEIDARCAARAIDAENLEAWVEDDRLHIGISPFLTTKDVDQTVLCVVKALCQFTGLKAVDTDNSKLHHRH